MKRVIKALALLLLLSCLLSVTVFAAEYSETGIYDVAGIISAEDESEIEKELAKASEKTGVKYILITSTNHSDKSFMFESAYDIVALEIVYNGGNYYYYPYTFGDPDYDITDDEMDRILDADGVYDNLKSGRISLGVAAFCELSVKANNGKLRGPLWKTLLICFIIAFVIASVTVGCIVYKYKKKLKAPSYPLDRYASLNLNSHSDMFLGKVVTKTRINTGSSGRSGSGGGRSGGGGGGRRGGR